MKRNGFSALPALAAVAVLTGVSLLEPLAVGTPGAGASAVEAPTTIAPIAQSISSCDLPVLRARLADASAASKTSTTRLPPTNVILGLAAQRCGQFSVALDALRSEPAEGAFGDLRLLALARSAIELGQYSIAADALDRLLSDFSSSPLFEQAILTANNLAETREDFAGVIAVVRRGRQWQLEDETSRALEMSAWGAGAQLDDESIRRAAAIQLLTRHPLTASKLEVIEEFRAQDGSIEWLAFLSAAQLVQRAESLLDAGLGESASSTLSEVPETERDWRWNLVSARTLTALGQGEEALSVLEAIPVPNRQQQIEREWQLAWAAMEVSAPKSGRKLTAAQRQMMRERAHAGLEAAIALGLDPDRARRALRVLFEDALEDDLFDHAMSTLRRLKALDPEDRTGAGQLWRLGWKEHSEHNYSGAVGYWSELSDLYPTSSYNRSGLYWSARAHEALGNPDRARQILAEVADVPFTDFYRRHALRRLGGTTTEPDEPHSPTEPWPRDPTLDRAEALYALGLHEAAQVELDALSGDADARSVRALRALTLAATGQRRRSIVEISAVFPTLGTPWQGMVPEQARRTYYPLAFDEIIAQHSVRNSLDRNLVLAMIRQESAFDPSALSWAGARGLMQVMPATGREIARRLGLKYSRESWSDPAFSIQLGTAYYKQVKSMFDDNDELSLAGYNAGPYRIKRLWRQAGANAELDSFLETLGLEETKSYVKRVLLFADSYSRLYADAG